MKNSYSRRVITSFIGIGLCIALISSAVFYGMSKKTIAEKHSLTISDYEKQSVFFVNKQLEKIREVVDLLLFDDSFKYLLRKEYDEFGAYDAIENNILPKCQNVLKIYDEPMGMELYTNNHTLNERYNKDRSVGVNILYEDRLKDDKYLAKMREQEKYILWTQPSANDRNNIKVYARLMNFGTMREEGVIILNVKANSIFPNSDEDNELPVFFGLVGPDISVGEIPPENELSNYVTDHMPLSVKDHEIVSYVSKDYYFPGFSESVCSILIVILISVILVLLLGTFMKKLLCHDVDLILDGIEKVKSGEENSISHGKYMEFNQIVDMINEYISNVDKLVEDVYETEIQKQDIEFSMLQSKINPHFLYNIFTIIRELAKEGFNESVVDIVDKTAAFYRNTLSKSTGDHTLREEIESVRNYAEIIEIIKHKEIVVRYDIDNEVLDAYIPRFLVQPIVENSVKHAVNNSQLLITVTAYNDNDRLIIEVGDNGIGMTPEQVEQCMKYKSNTGYGLYNIQRRLQLKYSDSEYGMNISSSYGNGTKIIFTLPYVTEYLEDSMYD